MQRTAVKLFPWLLTFFTSTSAPNQLFDLRPTLMLNTFLRFVPAGISCPSAPFATLPILRDVSREDVSREDVS